jgi:small subunit ribosomal protein S8
MAAGARPPSAAGATRESRERTVAEETNEDHMTMTDPIADMLTRIRNASVARHRELTLPSSRVKREIARILADEGFIDAYETRSDPESVQDQLVLRLKYVEGRTPVVTGLKRISKPGLRVYARKTEIPRVLGGLGVAILSTSHGIMTGNEARKQNLGGEVLCFVW